MTKHSEKGGRPHEFNIDDLLTTQVTHRINLQETTQQH